eukprot:TRINITY_DN11418_c0_g1_i4.p1 TRINITY_DN11418_c0_g1~~TRINITY_DN11418_c0_g1_i4.p1  ORF type:complete len:290 (-),score=26.32 TRINITY_DN11418_c0_g1_i4:140-1009(-)
MEKKQFTTSLTIVTINNVNILVRHYGIPKSRREQNWKQELINNEANILQHLSGSPYVVRVLGQGDAGEGPYLATECPAGGSLFELATSLSKKGLRLSEQRCRNLFRKLLHAVGSIHKNNVVHLDLKLEHVMLNEKGDIKLISFNNGYAYATGKIAAIRNIGTMQYRAPEFNLVENKELKRGISGKAADIFSLGVMLFIMYFGRYPFQSSCRIDKAYSLIIEEEYEKFWALAETESQVKASESLKQLITGMILYVPETRLNIGEMCNHPWVKGEVCADEEMAILIQAVRA